MLAKVKSAIACRPGSSVGSGAEEVAGFALLLVCVCVFFFSIF